jgi:molybdopterin converting factor small subunit
MIEVRLEIWIPLGELGAGFGSVSETCIVREEELEDGMTGGEFFSRLADQYDPVRTKIFDREKGAFYPEVVVTLNDRIIPPSDLCSRALRNKDKISVLPVFSGG